MGQQKDNRNKQLLREDYRHLQQEDYSLIEEMNNILNENTRKVAQELYNKYINADNMEDREKFRNKWVNVIKNTK